MKKLEFDKLQEGIIASAKRRYGGGDLSKKAIDHIEKNLRHLVAETEEIGKIKNPVIKKLSVTQNSKGVVEVDLVYEAGEERKELEKKED